MEAENKIERNLKTKQRTKDGNKMRKKDAGRRLKKEIKNLRRKAKKTYRPVEREGKGESERE